jgi:hypothetical protein
MAGERTQDLVYFNLFTIPLPMSYSSSPASSFFNLSIFVKILNGLVLNLTYLCSLPSNPIVWNFVVFIQNQNISSVKHMLWCYWPVLFFKFIFYISILKQLLENKLFTFFIELITDKQWPWIVAWWWHNQLIILRTWVWIMPLAPGDIK